MSMHLFIHAIYVHNLAMNVCVCVCVFDTGEVFSHLRLHQGLHFVPFLPNAFPLHRKQWALGCFQLLAQCLEQL